MLSIGLRFRFSRSTIVLNRFRFPSSVLAPKKYDFIYVSRTDGDILIKFAYAAAKGLSMASNCRRCSSVSEGRWVIQEGQKVVDTGLYAIIRHPMYLATVLMFIAMPLVLGLFYAFLVFLLYPAITVKRIRSEEEVLEKDLQGYA